MRCDDGHCSMRARDRRDDAGPRGFADRRRATASIEIPAAPRRAESRSDGRRRCVPRGPGRGPAARPRCRRARAGSRRWPRRTRSSRSARSSTRTRSDEFTQPLPRNLRGGAARSLLADRAAASIVCQWRPNAVEVVDLRKSYGSVEAVRGISFTVAEGEVFALLGPNGAGKTTTVEILEGFRRRDGGRVSVLGLRSRDRRSPAQGTAGHRPADQRCRSVPDRGRDGGHVPRLLPEAAATRRGDRAGRTRGEARLAGDQAVRRAEATARRRHRARRRPARCCSSTSPRPDSIPARDATRGRSSRAWPVWARRSS